MKAPKAPKHLQKATQKWWEAIALGFVLEQHHYHLLTLCCEAWDRTRQAREILDRDGLTYLDRFSAPRARPEVAIERDSRLAFARLLRELQLDISPPEESRPPKFGAAPQERS